MSGLSWAVRRAKRARLQASTEDQTYALKRLSDRTFEAGDVEEGGPKN